MCVGWCYFPGCLFRWRRCFENPTGYFCDLRFISAKKHKKRLTTPEKTDIIFAPSFDGRKAEERGVIMFTKSSQKKILTKVKFCDIIIKLAQRERKTAGERNGP